VAVSILKPQRGGFRIETAVKKPFQKAKRLKIYDDYL
jgi:hypothetical protein